MTDRARIEKEPQSSPARAAGTPLAPGLRQTMEARLGHSFADVRVHADDHAAASAKEIGARAYAIGPDVVFGARQFAPGTPAGRALLAHELAHVVQQRSPGEAEPDAAEAEARDASVSAGGLAPRLRTGARVAMQAEDQEPAMAEASTETALREQHSSEVAMLQEQRLEFARDRIWAATHSIAAGVADLRKRPEAERPALQAKVHAFETELALALSNSAELLAQRIPELEARAAAGESLKAEIATSRRELTEARADLETMKGIFSPARGAAFEETYRTKVAGLHCMNAAYTGLGALTSPEQADQVKADVARKAAASMKRKGHVNIDHFITVMDTARAANMAGPKQRARWNRKRKAWTPTLESLVRAHVSTSVPGFYFFGLAPAKAFHSVVIGVSTWEQPARTLWNDQYGTTVVGDLDAYTRGRLEGWRAGGLLKYTDWDTYVWQVLPPAAESLLSTPGKAP